MRFYAKFLRDLGLINFDEPALRYFTQGIVKGSDGEKMSKSRGNVVEPLESVEKFGADSLRLYLVSAASGDKDFDWDPKGLSGSSKFMRKLWEYFQTVKIVKNKNKKVQTKLNRAIEFVTKDIENFNYNLATIKVRQLFASFGEENDKETLEKFLQLLHPFCPHITEELWEMIGNKKLISLSEWPKAGKVDEAIEKAEEASDKLAHDITYLINLLKERENKEIAKIFVYVMPNEIKNFEVRALSKKLGKEIKVYAVNDKDKHDPKGKAKKAKPGRPAIYLE